MKEKEKKFKQLKHYLNKFCFEEWNGLKEGERVLHFYDKLNENYDLNVTFDAETYEIKRISTTYNIHYSINEKIFIEMVEIILEKIKENGGEIRC